MKIYIEDITQYILIEIFLDKYRGSIPVNHAKIDKRIKENPSVFIMSLPPINCLFICPKNNELNKFTE